MFSLYLLSSWDLPLYLPFLCVCCIPPPFLLRFVCYVPFTFFSKFFFRTVLNLTSSLYHHMHTLSVLYFIFPQFIFKTYYNITVHEKKRYPDTSSLYIFPQFVMFNMLFPLTPVTIVTHSINPTPTAFSAFICIHTVVPSPILPICNRQHAPPRILLDISMSLLSNEFFTKAKVSRD